VRVQVVPNEHYWAAQLLVGRVEQRGVVGLGEPLTPAAATAVGAIDQPRPVPGLDRAPSVAP